MKSETRFLNASILALKQSGHASVYELLSTTNQFIRERVETILRELAPAERESLITLMRRLAGIFEKFEAREGVNP